MKNLISIKIRKLGKSDFPGLKSLITGIQNFKNEEKVCALELIDYALKNKNQSDYIIYIAESGKNITGFIIYGWIDLTKGCYDLYWIATHKKFRKIGSGKKLMERMEKDIKKHKGRSIFIETSSKTNYLSARKFYTSCGYHKEACIKSFYDKNDDKIIYRKNIKK
ncbi:MAG: GNAT family N-acetyltransferase [Candidatus Aureabacteria bacterium]|nr:GNAT family N-acetyltransferase [Candidatus Auribacterota bacterium]